MARSRKAAVATGRRIRVPLYAIPLIAILGLAVGYVILTQPAPEAPAAMNFTFQLVLQESNKNSTRVGGLVPSSAIGEAGGFWATTQFNSYGVDRSHYPIYMDPPCALANSYGCVQAGACHLVNGTVVPPCSVHIKSTVVRNYTLGDFFNVWGMPLGENNTLNIKSSGNFAWQLCIGTNPATATFSTEWGHLVLTGNLALVLFYADYSTAGCATV